MPDERKQPLERLAALVRHIMGVLPPVETASPSGIVFQGADLSVPVILACYSRGIFPWYTEGLEPRLWWSPDPRCLLFPGDYHLPSRAARKIRRAGFSITLDMAFNEVLEGCGNRRETWLLGEMKTAYKGLYKSGFAHSVEAWLGGRLVGGLYGVTFGRAFFGESMFHTVTEASRACLAALNALLIKRGVTLLDCQQATEHVLAQGASLWPRDTFTRLLDDALAWRPRSSDALTSEYRTTSCVQAAWPWLPWTAHYTYHNGDWLESGRRSLPVSR